MINNPENLENKAYLHAILTARIFSLAVLSKLSKLFNYDYKNIWQSDPISLKNHLDNIYDNQKINTADKTRSFKDFKEKFNVKEQWQKLESINIKTTTPSDQEYPSLLKEIHYPPLMLYYRGCMRNDLFNISVVGSRKITGYGRECTEFILTALTGMPICIISGLAFGTDAYAHQIAIKNNFATVAVLGSGVDPHNIYPRQNIFLANQILNSGGAVISEFPPGTKALKSHFPQRNRIISGISKCTVIIEANLASGALITAACALEQNRDIFAMPGSIFNTLSAGPNSLIKNARAKALTSADDLINEYPQLNTIHGAGAANAAETSGLNPIQLKIFDSISNHSTSLDEIKEKTGLPFSEISSALIMLEIKNKIKPAGNNYYAKNLTRINPRR